MHKSEKSSIKLKLQATYNTLADKNEELCETEKEIETTQTVINQKGYHCGNNKDKWIEAYERVFHLYNKRTGLQAAVDTLSKESRILEASLTHRERREVAQRISS